METLHRQIDPAGQARSASRYSQAVETAAGLRHVFVSGQIGMNADGSVAATAREQHELCWRNVLGLLAEAGMGPEHLVRVNGYLVGADQVPVYREVRDQVLGDAKPASTVVLVAGLVLPELVVEIEAVAAA
jgi:enamine deaminase RidA (YjgF/YER057c/UK114 family)